MTGGEKETEERERGEEREREGERRRGREREKGKGERKEEGSDEEMGSIYHSSGFFPPGLVFTVPHILIWKKDLPGPVQYVPA